MIIFISQKRKEEEREREREREMRKNNSVRYALLRASDTRMYWCSGNETAIDHWLSQVSPLHQYICQQHLAALILRRLPLAVCLCPHRALSDRLAVGRLSPARAYSPISFN